MAETFTKLNGKSAVLMVRKLSDAAVMPAQLIPYQTSLTFDPSVDSDTTATKSGTLASSSSVETDLEFEFTNNNHFMADELRHALFNGEKMEMWVINKDRLKLNADGTTKSAYAWYMRGNVQEDSNDNDADDLSTRDVTFTVDGTPTNGWVTMTGENQEAFDYIFRGIDIAKGEDDKAGGVDYDDSTDGASRPAGTPSETE